MGFGDIFKSFLGIGNKADDTESNPFASILGTMGSGLTAGLTGAMTNSLFGQDPVDETKRMMDTLYPGTTPYERLSNGGGGVGNTGALESLSQKNLNAQINAQKRQADIETKRIQTQADNVKDTNTTNLVTAIMNNMKMGAASVNGNPFAVEYANFADKWINERLNGNGHGPTMDKTPPGQSGSIPTAAEDQKRVRRMRKQVDDQEKKNAKYGSPYAFSNPWSIY